MDIKKFHYTLTEKLSFTNIENLTFNGLHYIFLSSHSPKVILLDRNFKLFKAILLHQSYSNICFDNLQKCYWAISNNDASIIYKLNSDFSEVNKISIRGVKDFNATGLSFDHYNSCLWISFTNCIGYIKKGTTNIQYLSNKYLTMSNIAILALPHCILISYIRNCNQFIEIFDVENCKYLFECCPKEYEIKDITLTSFPSCKNTYFTTYDISLLLSKKCSNTKFIMNCSINFCEAQPPKFIYKNSKNIKHDCYDISENNFNCEYFSHCHSNKFNCNVKYEIMHSIALEEAAIAHILNAEGEKIQKAVACSNSIENLLCINESVKQTIIHITQLETQLYLKLSALQLDDYCNSKYNVDSSCDVDCKYLFDKKNYF